MASGLWTSSGHVLQAAAQAEQVQVRMDAEKEEKLRIKAEQTGESYTPSSPTKKQAYATL